MEPFFSPMLRCSRSWAAYVAGALIVLMHECGARFTDGISILVSSAVPEGKGVSSSAAVEVSIMQALAAAHDIPLDGRRLALLCQKVCVRVLHPVFIFRLGFWQPRTTCLWGAGAAVPDRSIGVAVPSLIEKEKLTVVLTSVPEGGEEMSPTLLACVQVENCVVGAPCGVMDQMTSALGEAGKLLALRCQPAEMLDPVALPPNIQLWGVDSGIRHRSAVACNPHLDPSVLLVLWLC
jgi:galactokinase